MIALALVLDRCSLEGSKRIRCIADSDFDFVMGSKIESNHLEYTDYTSIEMYSCNVPTWIETIGLGFGYSAIDVNNLITTMIPVWNAVFLVRATYTQLEWDWCFAPLADYCRVKMKSVVFDESKFIERSLRDAGHIAQWSEFCKIIEELKNQKIDDPRKSIHKDDYLELLGWYLYKRSRWDGYLAGGNGIWANLKSALEIEYLAKEPMFGIIDEFLSTTSSD